jgi:hypothetical protein
MLKLDEKNKKFSLKILYEEALYEHAQFMNGYLAFLYEKLENTSIKTEYEML